jgi:aspartate aminotransferase-like enzyme
MEDKEMLMIPGPTPVPEKVLQALAKHPIGHRSEDFIKLTAEVDRGLQWLHQTKNEVLCLTVSGTGAMEAGIINFLSPGDRVLVGTNGKFGDRWAELSNVFGLKTETIAAQWGQALDPEVFRAKLAADTDKEIKAVILTHSETSTGVLNDLETINKYVREHGKALIIVDAVTSLGAYNLPVDEWGLDVVVSASQKGYMTPPGLGFIAVSDRAWQAYETAKFPRFYLDLAKYKKNNAPFTPPINLINGLQVALQMMQREGLDNIFARHQRLTQATRAGIKALGLKLFAPDNAASPAVTTVDTTPVEAEKIRSIMKQKYDIALASGQDHLKGKILRIGHLGFMCDRDILTALSCLEATLIELGYSDFAPKAAVIAATKVLV